MVLTQKNSPPLSRGQPPPDEGGKSIQWHEMLLQDYTSCGHEM